MSFFFLRNFFLRRDFLGHKVQYSKVPLADMSAAFLGVAVGAYLVYLSLNTFGSGGIDLSDLTSFL
jgi:hypothetical protein